MMKKIHLLIECDVDEDGVARNHFLKAHTSDVKLSEKIYLLLKLSQRKNITVVATRVVNHEPLWCDGSIDVSFPWDVEINCSIVKFNLLN